MKTFKTQIYLNKYAEAYCKRAFGVRRVISGEARTKARFGNDPVRERAMNAKVSLVRPSGVTNVIMTTTRRVLTIMLILADIRNPLTQEKSDNVDDDKNW